MQPSGFIEAEIETLQQEKKESAGSLRKEMEPEIAADSLPGHDIAGAYRRIRKGKLRPAIIYLDRLQSKYPNWFEIYELKALAFELSHEAAGNSADLGIPCLPDRAGRNTADRGAGWPRPRLADTLAALPGSHGSHFATRPLMLPDMSAARLASI